jgi:hypothetical protein
MAKVMIVMKYTLVSELLEFKCLHLHFNPLTVGLEPEFFIPKLSGNYMYHLL